MKLRDLWSVLLLAGFAAVFLLIAGNSLTKEAAAAAGFAFAGAAIARAVDVVQERRKEIAAADARRGVDLDETRRLAYMALVAAKTEKYELVATAANALAHHSLRVSFDEAATHLTAVINGGSASESERWLKEKIDAITKRLDAQAVRDPRVRHTV